MNKRFRVITIILILNVLLVAALFTVFLLQVVNKGHFTGNNNTTTQPTSMLPTVRSSGTTTSGKRETTTEDHEFCDPTTPTNMIIAYSNDFSPDFVTNLYEMLPGFVNNSFAMLGSIKFDTMNKESFVFEKEWTDLVDAIKDDLPDPALGFESNDTGSDVLNMIERYLDTTSVPICGSILRVYVKRYPDEVDIDQLVSKLRYYHITLNFMVSYSTSGGSHPETLYNIATRTNGLCVFSDEEDLYWVIGTPILDRVYLAYSANPEVSGEQVVSLPQMSLPAKCGNWFSATVQENEPPASTDTAFFQFGSTYKLGIENGVSYRSGSGNFRESYFSLNDEVNNVTLTCKFGDAKVRRLQLRVYVYCPLDHWLPYDD